MLSLKFIKDLNKQLVRLKNNGIVPAMMKLAQYTQLLIKRKTLPKEMLLGHSMEYSLNAPTTAIVTKSASLATGTAIDISEDSYDIHRLEQPPQRSSQMTKEEALSCYRDMVRIRKMEQLSFTLYLDRKIRGFCHLYNGEEACAVGLKSVQGPDDTVITAYRCHGWALLMGVPMEEILAELLGKKTGVSRGKGGSMHMYSKTFFGGNGIVGGHVPLGTGIALAHQYRKNNAISWTVYGDGAADQGQTFESFNMAMLWKLPVIYVVENNQYAMGTATHRHSANTKYYTRGDLIPGIRVNGMDLLAVREAGRVAVNHVKEGKGPILLQLDTYRFLGHSMSDPGTSYRTPEEVKTAKQSRDCIRIFAEKLTASQLITEDELKAIDEEAKKEVKLVADKCLKETEPPLEELIHDIYQEFNFTVKTPQVGIPKNHKNSSPFVKKIKNVK